MRAQREVNGLEKQVAADDGASDRLRQLSEDAGTIGGGIAEYTAIAGASFRLQRQVDSLQKAVVSRGRVRGPRSSRACMPTIRVPLRSRESWTRSPPTQRAGRIDGGGRLARQFGRLQKAPWRSRPKSYGTCKRTAEVLGKSTPSRPKFKFPQNLETERKGEKFTMIKPPQPPRPISPKCASIELQFSERGPGSARSMAQNGSTPVGAPTTSPVDSATHMQL